MTTLSSLSALPNPAPQVQVSAHQATRAAKTARDEVHTRDRTAAASDAQAAAKANDLAAAKPIADAMSGLSTVALISAALSSMPATFGLAHNGTTFTGQIRAHNDDRPGSNGMSAGNSLAGYVVASAGASSQSFSSSKKGGDSPGSNSGSQSQSRPGVDASTGAAGKSESAASPDDSIGSTFGASEAVAAAQASGIAEMSDLSAGALALSPQPGTAAGPAIARAAGLAQFQQSVAVQREPISIFA